MPTISCLNSSSQLTFVSSQRTAEAGYYDNYCYLPLYVFCGDHVLCARLTLRPILTNGVPAAGGKGRRRFFNTRKTIVKPGGEVRGRFWLFLCIS
jgi:hypothetical protein